ncbi:hypothetical protein K661_03148, partial [Piscirickettsia salmonis LF-89 = ATCC VR-1361]
LPQLRSAKNPNLPRPTHPVLSTPWLAAFALAAIENSKLAAKKEHRIRLFII